MINQLKTTMLDACVGDVEKEKHLHQLFANYPFQVVDLSRENEGLRRGEACAGLFSEDDGVLLSTMLLNVPIPDDVLSIYLHEVVHARAFADGRTGWMRHDDHFAQENQHLHDAFGIESAASNEYCTRDSIERKTIGYNAQERAAWVVGGAMALAAYGVLKGWPWPVSAGLVGVAAIFVFAELLRRSKT